MQKIQIKKVERTERLYNFYCDNCGKHLGKSVEYDDGYVEELGKYETHTYLNGLGWFHYEATLCDECKNKKIKEISESLKIMGFEQEKSGEAE